MAEDVKPAESAPAPAPAPAAPAVEETPTLGERLQKATPAERRAFELHRTMPPEIKTSEPVPGKTAPESEPGKSLEHKETPEERSERDRGYQQRRSQLKTQLAESERRGRDLERRLAEATHRKPESAPGERVAVAPESIELVLPDIEEFKTTQAYNAAVAKAVSDHTRKVAKLEVEQSRHEAAQMESRRQAEERLAELNMSWNQRESEFQKDHKDYLGAKKQLADFFKPLPQDHPYRDLDEEIVELEDPALVHYLGTKAEVFQHLLDLPIKRAIAELHRIQFSLGKPTAPVVKTISSAPPPAKPVGGRAAAVVDPMEAARANGDWPTYNRIADERKRARLGYTVK